MGADLFPGRLDQGVRRLVTGVDARGRAVVVADECVTGDPRGLPIWSADAPPRTGEAAAPAVQGWWPPPGGVRVTLSSRPPDRLSPTTAAARAWPDINDAAGFHASRSADIVIVISGRIWLELDDGVEVQLAAGDTLVQNGTRHRWRNHGDDWPIMAVGHRRRAGCADRPMNEADHDGRLAVLVDRAWQDGRGRGILFAPAGRITAADVVTMATSGRGICSVTINEATAMRLGLRPQGRMPRADPTPYSVNSVESTACRDTGISAAERAITLRTLGDPTATVDDVVTPGHIMVEVARNVLRDGATLPEVANALLSARRIARFAGWTEILDDDGELADAAWCVTLAGRLGLPCLDAERAIAFARVELSAWDAAVRFSNDVFG